MREVPRLLRAGLPVALNDAALSAYSSVPAPLVNVTAPPVEAAGFASADKMFKLGSVLPFTLASAFQSWVTEEHGLGRIRRLHIALTTHAAFGVLGAVILAGLGYWRSEEHTSELQSLMRISYAVFCLKKKRTPSATDTTSTRQD